MVLINGAARMDSESIAERITQFFGGVFLFFFGLPFTLVPFLIFGEFRGMDAGLFETIFLTAFAIPFFLVGLLVQFMGLSAMFGWISNEEDPGSIPRKLPPGPDGISITEHPDSGYLGDYLRQSEAINGRIGSGNEIPLIVSTTMLRTRAGHPAGVLMTGMTPVVRTGLMEDGFHTMALNSPWAGSNGMLMMDSGFSFKN